MNNFDEFLSKSLKSAKIPIETPIADIEKEIRDKARRRQESRNARRRMIVSCAAAVVIISLSFSILLPDATYAFKTKIYQTISNFGKNISIKFSREAPPIINDKAETAARSVQAEVPFTVYVPKYVPEGFEFTSIEKSPTNQNPKVVIKYSNQDQMIVVTETSVPSKRSYTVTAQGDAEKVQVGRYDGNLLTFDNGTCNLIWISEDNIEFKIVGNVTPKQAFEMAESMQ